MAILRRDKALEFALSHHKNVRGDPLEFEQHFFMLDILADPSPRTAIMSAVQTGKTESFIAKMMADCAMGLSAFYVLPSQDSRNVFVHNRIDRLFDLVPKYNEMAEESLGSADSVTLKHIGKGVVRFGASESIREFKEFPADVLYVDEYDVCDASGLAFAYDRCKGSPYRFTHYLSNPSLPGSEYRFNIDWLFQNSDAKKLHYKCTSCGTVQPMEWNGNIVKEIKQDGVVIDYELCDSEWELSSGRDIHCMCIKCGTVIDRGTDCVGWIATGEPNHPVSGYQISRLAVPTDEIMELYDSFKAALANPTKMQTFYNSDLGYPYEGGVGNKITEELVSRCVETYQMPSISHGPCSMGIDVGSQFDIRISDYVLEDREGTMVVRRRLLFVGKVPSLAEIYKLIERYHVVVAVIDAAPDIHTSKEFQRKAPCRVWRCQYHPSEGANPRSVRWDRGSKKKPNKEPVVFVDRTEAMDSVYSQYVNRHIIEPPTFNDILGGKYIQEMLNPVRVVEEKTGRYVWVKCVDHAFHANVYDWLASQDPFAGLLSILNKPIVRGTKRSTRRQYKTNMAEVVDGILKKSKRYTTWKDVTG